MHHLRWLNICKEKFLFLWGTSAAYERLGDSFLGGDRMSSVHLGSLMFIFIFTQEGRVLRGPLWELLPCICGQTIKSFTNSAYGAPQYTPLFSLYHKVGTNKMVKYSGPHTHQNMRYKIDDICLSLLENIYLMGSCGGGGGWTVFLLYTEMLLKRFLRRFEDSAKKRGCDRGNIICAGNGIASVSF